MLKLALFGSPVSHSPSPGVHRAFGAQFGLEVDYELIEADEDTFAERLATFHETGGSGCNITLPLKHLAFEQSDKATQRANLANAANTLWWDSDVTCQSDNTDGEGLVRDLENNLDIPIDGRKVLLLGAGGAAAGVLGALMRRKPLQMIIVNRTIERARSLARRHAALGDIVCVSLDDIDCCGAVDLFIEATSMGHSGEHPKVSPAIFEGSPVVYSLNYGPAARGMYALSKIAGVPFHNGLGMLVEQAACSFEIWTGKSPDTAPVLSSLRKSEV